MSKTISSKLSNWISQAESVQAFADFNLPVDSAAKYTIIPKYDDFFIQLYCIALETLSDEQTETSDLLYLAKGLDVFCKKNDLSNFSGVDIITTKVLSAALKFIAGRYSTAFLMVKNINFAQVNDNPEALLTLSILKRSFPPNGFIYQDNLSSFFQSGDTQQIDKALTRLKRKLDNYEELTPLTFFETSIAFRLLNYFKHNNICTTLLEVRDDYNFWAQYLNENFKSKIWSFFPSQQKAISNHLLDGECSVSLQMPTSAGKTALCELVIYHFIKTNPDKKIAILAPFRALASELKASLGKRIQRYGISVKALYGGARPNLEELQSADSANLLIATPEKLMAVEDMTPTLFDNLKLVLCDEGHLLDDDSRGLEYELFLTRLKVQKADQIKFIYLSAIVPNVAQINEWLGGNDESVVTSSYRPTDISLASLTQTKQGRNYNLQTNQHLGAREKYQLYNFIKRSDYQYINPSTNRKNTYNFYSKKTNKSAACALRALSGGVVALFATTKKKHGVNGLCTSILEQLNVAKKFDIPINNPLDYCNTEQQQKLVEYISTLFSPKHILTQCLKNGFALHHGSLPQFVREIIENEVRNENIRLVVCTNTLAEGVNLPIRSLILHTTKRYSHLHGKLVSLRIRDLKNLIGRVGRAGKETNGFVFIPHPEDTRTVEKAITDSKLEPVTGSLFNIVEQITRIAQKEHIEITNDALETTDETFLTILDCLDSTIIELTNSDTPLEDIEEILTSLIEKTFSYTQSDPSEKETLKTLFSVRAEKLKDNYTLDQVLAMKKNGLTQRLYEATLNNIDFDSEIWEHTTTPTDENWLTFILNGVLSVSAFEQTLNRNSITSDDFISVLISWMNGATYEAISSSNDLTVDAVIELTETVIGYNFINIASKIIRLKEDQLPDKADFPEAISNWSYYAQHGINTQTERLLHQLGFTERLSLTTIANIINTFFGTQTDRSALTQLLHREKTRLLNAIVMSDLPQLAKEEAQNSYQQLEYLW